MRCAQDWTEADLDWQPRTQVLSSAEDLRERRSRFVRTCAPPVSVLNLGQASQGQMRQRYMHYLAGPFMHFHNTRSAGKCYHNTRQLSWLDVRVSERHVNAPVGAKCLLAFAEIEPNSCLVPI